MRPLAALALVAVAVVVGFAAAWGVMTVLGAMLPPFQPEDDDTLREYIPVALAYMTWAATTLIVLVVGLGRLRQSR